MRSCRAESFRARALRKAATPAERALWELLRDRRLSGAKFRRQHPIGPFVVDFFCAEAWLVVEADGAPHRRERSRDAARDHWLESLGLTVLRFFNRDILEHTEDVLRRIRVYLVASRSWPNLDPDVEPHPEPAPRAVLDEDPGETPSEPLSRGAGEGLG